MAGVFMALMYSKEEEEALFFCHHVFLTEKRLAGESVRPFRLSFLLVFTLSVAPGFGIFHRLCERSDRELGLGKVLGSRPPLRATIKSNLKS